MDNYAHEAVFNESNCWALQMSTIKDVARFAGVSVGTVSNVLNRPSYVEPEMRVRVTDAIAQLGYVPKSRARQYRSGRKQVFAVSVADLANPFFTQFCASAERAARDLGAAMLFADAGEDPEREEQNLSLLENQRVQGVIVMPVDEKSARLRSMVKRGIPMVFIDRVPSDLSAPIITIDNHKGGLLAASHVEACGCLRPAFLGSPDIGPAVAARLKGFSHGLVDHGRTAPDVWEAPIWTVDEGRKAAHHFLGLPEAGRADIVFCANDLLAIGFIQTCMMAGVRVPEDVAVIGFDDLSLSRDALPIGLTTIRQPFNRLAEMAIAALHDALTFANGVGVTADEGRAAPSPMAQKASTVAPKLIQRDSTLPIAARSS